MYESFYKLNANPFRLAPDPRFCFSHRGYKYAREYLSYALRLGEGFIVVTGQPGTGKTTLAETFIKELEVSRVVAERIVAPSLGAMGLLRSVAIAFGLPAGNVDRAMLRSEIKQFFTRQVRGGRRVLLIIDEAQGLPHSALEELRLLADLQSGSQSLLQIFLIGQCSLRNVLQVPDMNHFQQRVLATCHLEPLALAETAAYMEYRLKQAGWKGDPEFTGEAVQSIYQYSHGIPRHINKLCNRLLLIGYGREKHTIDQGDVEDISVEMRLEKLMPISGDEDNQADLPDIPLDTELPENGPSLCSLALGPGDSTLEASALAGETGPDTGPEARVYPGEAADWPVEAAAAACRPEQTEPEPVDSLRPVETAGEAVRHWSSAAKHRLRGIHHLVVKPVLLVAALGAAVVSASVLMRSHDNQPVAGDFMVASRTGSQPETSTGSTDGQAPAVKPVATVQKTPEVVDDRQVAAVKPVTGIQDAEVAVNAVVAQASPAGQKNPAVVDDRQVARVKPVTGIQGAGVAVNAVVTQVSITEKPLAVPHEPPPAVSGQPRPLMSDPPVNPEPVTVSRDALISGWLVHARHLLERNRLLVPSGDNAYDYYHRVLALDPGNQEALDGIGRVADRYAALAGHASQQQDPDKARLYVERGLRVQPDNATLIVMKTTMDYPPAGGVEVVGRSIPAGGVVVVDRSIPAGGAEVVDRSIVATRELPEPVSVFAEIKDFLVNGKHSRMTPTRWGEGEAH